MRVAQELVVATRDFTSHVIDAPVPRTHDYS